MPGTVVFKPIEANITHNTELIGKMDPYCLFHVGNQKIKGQVCRKGGKHPQWEDSIVIPITSQPTCVIDIKDKDLFIDDKIGTFEVDLREVEVQGRIKKWYPFFYKEKPAGEILLEAIYTGDTTAPVTQGLVPSSNIITSTAATPDLTKTTVTVIQPPQKSIILDRPQVFNQTTSTPYIVKLNDIGAEIPAGSIYGSQTGPVFQGTNTFSAVGGAYPLTYSTTIANPVYSNPESFAVEALLKGTAAPQNVSYYNASNQGLGASFPYSGYTQNGRIGNSDPGIISISQNVIPSSVVNQQTPSTF